MKILIAGDLYIPEYLFSKELIDQSITHLFNGSDYNIVNLEAPITNNKIKILKTGPHLKSNKNLTLDILKLLRIDMVTLANNHIKDYDEQGVIDTITFCKENNIVTVGAGANSQEASRIFYLDTPEGKIAIINIAENEWASATENSAGANGMNLIDDTTNIQKAKRIADFIFIIAHGGHEYYNLPSPRMQKQYRYYVDQGADLVVGHHTHCISGYEIYKNAPIYYGLGNFLFTEKSLFASWYKGLVLEVSIDKQKLTTNIHYTHQDQDSLSLSLSKVGFSSEVSNYNDIISNPIELKNKWLQYVEEKNKYYLYNWSIHSFIKNKYFSGVLKRLNLKLINKRALTIYLNMIRCEAHWDLSKEVIEKYVK